MDPQTNKTEKFGTMRGHKTGANVNDRQEQTQVVTKDASVLHTTNSRRQGEADDGRLSTKKPLDNERRRFMRLKRPSEGNSDSDDNLFVPATWQKSSSQTKSPNRFGNDSRRINGDLMRPPPDGSSDSKDSKSSAFETITLNSDAEDTALTAESAPNMFSYNSNAASSMAHRFRQQTSDTVTPPEVVTEESICTANFETLSSPDMPPVGRARTSSIVDGLLFEIYDKLNFGRRWSGDSDTYTEYSTVASSVDARRHSSSGGGSAFNKGHQGRLQRNALELKASEELKALVRTSRENVTQVANELVRQLKRRDRLVTRRDRNYDIVTAILQAASLKRRVDTKMRFSVEPFPGDSGFSQWHDAMRMVARLPGGIPWEFRKRLWLTMADKHVQHRKVDWERVKRFCFNDRSNPDDNELGVQIVKDLHRTGCSLFCGQDAEHNQALLKRVLLAYARWNKTVGYCQGFNMLAALILEVMEWKEEDALKVMIYLIEGVLPASYFANNLRGLSVDMAVFRDLLRLRLASLSRHLDHLQLEARDSVSGTSYEPPLTNVFTMQWFLTLFSNCLPKATVLRVWDLIFLEGNEVLLRTALTIWDGLADRIMAVDSADEFYSIMGVLTREMLEFGLMDANHLVKTICTMAPFPFPQLGELRDKYTYNITPFTAAAAAVGVAKRGLRLFSSDDEEDNEEDQMAVAAWCFASVFPPQLSPIKAKGEAGLGGRSPSPSSAGTNFTSIGPGAFGVSNVNFPDPSRHTADSDRMSLDISALKKQYAKLRERQKQAHIILTTANSRQQPVSSGSKVAPIAVNHLLIGKKPLIMRRNSQGSMGLIKFQFKSNTATTTTASATKKTTAPAGKGASGFGVKGTAMAKDRGGPVRVAPSNSHTHITTLSRLNDRKNSLPTPESGETLHWKDAKRRVRKSTNSSSATLSTVSSEKQKPKKNEEDDSSSTSTELCDEDVGHVSDLGSDLEEEEDASHGSSTATTTGSTERHSVVIPSTQHATKSESSDGDVSSLRSTSTPTTNIPSVVVSPGDWSVEWPSFTSDQDNKEDNTEKKADDLVELSSDRNAVEETRTCLSVSKWIDSFDKGLLDSDSYQVLEIVADTTKGGEAIVEVSRKPSESSVADENDYSVEKREEWLAKLEMYRRTLGVDNDQDGFIRTVDSHISSDEFHSLSDSTPWEEEEEEEMQMPESETSARPSVLKLTSEEATSPSEVDLLDFNDQNEAETAADEKDERPFSPFHSSNVKRYFDQGSPIRTVPTAYVPGATGSIVTDMQDSSPALTTTQVIRSKLDQPKTPTSPTKSPSSVFNPFPTTRKSQLWGNNEIGLKLGLYENRSKATTTTTTAANNHNHNHNNHQGSTKQQGMR